jgi:hypothetical protein
LAVDGVGRPQGLTVAFKVLAKDVASLPDNVFATRKDPDVYYYLKSVPSTGGCRSATS